MIIFITGPSGVGKSTLRDYYCNKKQYIPLRAFTTRPSREGEVEIHRTITIRDFNKMQKNNELCLVKTNHGFKYGYSVNELKEKHNCINIFEVDSQTAIKECKKYYAIIVRIIPGDFNKAVEQILYKRDNTYDRLRDFIKQMDKNFLRKRELLGDKIFVNDYLQDSLINFYEFMEDIIHV